MKNFILSLLLLAGIGTSVFAQQDVNGWYWMVGKPTGNTLYDVKIISPSIIYAVGSRGTFMKSTDAGDSWMINSQVGSPDGSSTGNLATRDLNAMFFMNANTGVAGGSTQTVMSGPAPGVISRTTDGGDTWSYIQYNDTAGTINGLYFIDTNTGYLCGGNRARFMKTTDGGLTWEDQSYSTKIPSQTYNAVFAIDTTKIFLATSSGKIATHLPGQDSAWKLRQLPGATSSNTIQDIIFKDANTGYACGSANYFAYTTDGGLTWTQSNAPATEGQRDLTYNSGTLYMAGSYTEIYKSTNDGVNWTAVNFIDGSNPHQPTPFIIYGIDANANDIMVVGNAGIINYTNDGGTTWRNKNYSVDNLGSTNYQSMLVSPDIPDVDIWLGPNGGGSLLYSSNGGTNWVARATSHTRSVYGIQFVNSSTGYICGGFPNNPFGVGEISKTTDGGLTWNLLTLSDPNMATSQLNSLSFVDANTGYIAAFRSIFEPEYIYKTTDGGLNWTPQSLETNPNGSAISVQMIDANTGFVLGNSGGALYKTTNGGTNWVKNLDPYLTSTSWSNMLVVDKNIIYMHGAGTSGAKKIVRTVDGGATWTDLTGNLLSTFTVFRSRWLNLNHGIVSGTNGYMAKTTNGGLNWTATNTGGSTTVDCAIPNKNLWFTVSDRNSSYEAWKKTENLTSISVNATVGIEGFWRDTTQVADTVTCTLRNSSSPYGPVDQAKYKMNVGGYGTFEYYTATSGSYYLQMTHRNALETWSAAPVAVVNGGNHNYDFTPSAGQAYGNNMVLKPGRFCFYSGDPNQDGTIDLSDITQVFNDAGGFVTGYVATDINGDDFVDLTDIVITFNNSSNFVSKIVP